MRGVPSPTRRSGASAVVLGLPLAAAANPPDAWYLRSSAVWSFNLRDGSYAIPFGIGAGKVWKSGTTTINVFGKPQWSVAHDGDGQPKFQFCFGVNLQFRL